MTVGKKIEGSEYTEDDIARLLKNPRFVEAVRAYANDEIAMLDIPRRVFDGPPYVPEGLDALGFGSLIIEVADRIKRGEIS